MPDPTLRALAARMCMADLDVTRFHREREYRESRVHLVRGVGVGGIIIFNGTIGATRTAVDALQVEAGRRLLVACDLEPGLGNRLLDATEFPHAMAISRGEETQCEDVAACIAHEASLAGITIDFAPVCDINSNPLNPIINVRAFGDEAGTVSRFAKAFIRGAHRGGLRSVIKHYPGHGDTAVDSHLALPVLASSLEQMESRELVPFREAITAGADGVMAGHIFAPAIDPVHPVSLSSNWIHNRLRPLLGAGQLVFTDALNMRAVRDRYDDAAAAVQAIAAGNDVLVMPPDVEGAVIAIAERSERDPELGTALTTSNLRLDRFLSYERDLPRIWDGSAAALSDRIARNAIAIRGAIRPLSASETVVMTLLGLPEDREELEFLRGRLSAAFAGIRHEITLEVKTDSLQRKENTRHIFLMYFRPSGFRGRLGDLEAIRRSMDSSRNEMREFIAISLGNPYIWPELPELACCVDTYSSSRPSLVAVTDVLAARLR